MGKLVHGIGVNDADYRVTSGFKRNRTMCPFYRRWQAMLERCYNARYQAKKTTYIGCLVCDEWLVFSNFKKWMEKQDWEGKELDKDLLFRGNKTYSPETCVFVDRVVNTFVLDRKSVARDLPVGVTYNKEKRKYQSGCSNPFTKRMEYLGYFDCVTEAHEAWRNRKCELAHQLAAKQENERVAAALMSRYSRENYK